MSKARRASPAESEISAENAEHRVRVVALLGHRSCGKTTLGDHLLAAGGVVRAAGRVDEGTSLLDHEDEEKRRKTTLKCGVAWLDWHGVRVELIDAPGAEGLFHEQNLALSMVDGALVVVSAHDGVQIGTRRALDEVARTRSAAVAVVTRMDKATDVQAIVADLTAAAGVRAVPLQVPWIVQGQFTGLIDLWTRKLSWAEAEPVPAPEAAAGALQIAWDQLVEAVALSDDSLLERYLEDLDLPAEIVREALPRAVMGRKLLPVLFAAPFEGLGVSEVLDTAVQVLPSPRDRRPPFAVDADTGEDWPVLPDGGFVAQLLATRFDAEGGRYRVLRVWGGEAPRGGTWHHAETGETFRINKLYALRGPRSSSAKSAGPGNLVATWEPMPGRPGDTYTAGPRWVIGAPPMPAPMYRALLVASSVSGERVRNALLALQEMDPALDVGSCELTSAPVVGGVTQEHVDRAFSWLRERMSLPVDAALPPVPYREIPALDVEDVLGTHEIGDDGDRTEYAQVVVALGPTHPRAIDLEFAAEVPEDLVPSRYWPAIGSGARQALRHGPLAGYPVSGAWIRCHGGDYDMLATKDDHFVAAAEKAVVHALAKAGTQLLEPWWRVEIRVPADEIGPVMAEINARRGRVHGLEVDGHDAAVLADCPYRELRSFGPRLQQLTAGRGRFAGHPDHYELLPASLVKEAVNASPFQRRSSG